MSKFAKDIQLAADVAKLQFKEQVDRELKWADWHVGYWEKWDATQVPKSKERAEEIRAIAEELKQLALQYDVEVYTPKAPEPVDKGSLWAYNYESSGKPSSMLWLGNVHEDAFRSFPWFALQDDLNVLEFTVLKTREVKERFRHPHLEYRIAQFKDAQTETTIPPISLDKNQ